MPSQLTLEQHQQTMTRHLRDPDHAPAPQQVDDRRLGIYRELVFNNVESQLAGSFPVIKSILGTQQWLGLARAFLRDYRSQTPYFTQLSAEFVLFLSERKPQRDDPAFLVELAHYERVELDLYMEDKDESEIQPAGEDLLETPLGLTSVAVPLAYQYPVHRIGPGYRPEQAPAQPTCLLIFQDEAQEVRFLELQPLAYHLVTRLKENREARHQGATGRALLTGLAEAMQVPPDETFMKQGEDLLKQLQALNVLTDEGSEK